MDAAVPALEEVESALGALLGSADDPKLFPGGVESSRPEERVVGSEILNRLFRRFLLTDYRKVDDGAALALRVAINAPERLEALRSVVKELRQDS